MGKIHKLPPNDLFSWYRVELDNREYGEYSRMVNWLEEHAEGDCYMHNSGTFAVSFQQESDRTMFALIWVKQ
jgi:hypothetical protein